MEELVATIMLSVTQPPSPLVAAGCRVKLTIIAH